MLKPSTIAEYTKENKPVWTCEMPEGCPPDDIQVPLSHSFFRLAQNFDTYSAQDFMSYAELYPNRPW